MKAEGMILVSVDDTSSSRRTLGTGGPFPGGGSSTRCGNTRLAEAFGVSGTTISSDLRAIFQAPKEQRPSKRASRDCWLG